MRARGNHTHLWKSGKRMQDGVVHVPRTFFKAIIFIFNVFIIKFDMRFMGAISSHIRFTRFLCRTRLSRDASSSSPKGDDPARVRVRVFTCFFKRNAFPQMVRRRAGCVAKWWHSRHHGAEHTPGVRRRCRRRPGARAPLGALRHTQPRTPTVLTYCSH